MNNGNMMHSAECKCFSWSPIFAGALVAMGLSFLLNLFSVAIGLTAFTTGSDGVETLALGGLLGAAIGVIAAMFTAGWVAGYLSQRHCGKRHLGALHGFLAWGVALIIAVLMASHIQQYVSFYAHFLSGAATEVQITNTANGAVTVITKDMRPGHVVISSYILFSLFFLSAFASSLGGHCGTRHVCKHQGSC